VLIQKDRSQAANTERSPNVPIWLFLEPNKNVLETFYLVSYLWVIDE